MKQVELRPIKESTEDYEAIEERIKSLFRREIYLPILRELAIPKSTIQNDANDPIKKALRTGRITYERGAFRGKFTAQISRQMRRLEARWDKRRAAWVIPEPKLPPEVKTAIDRSEHQFQAKIAEIDRRLAQILPEKLAGSLQISKLFDRTLAKTDREFQGTIRGITVAPKLTPDQRKKISDEWQSNMRLWIQKFTEEEIVKLRTEVKTAVFSGNRYESMVRTLQRSYHVSENKAKFLARQETGLLMAKFRETRYTDAGILEYKWCAVAGSKNHPVRPAHKALADQSARGKIFTWSDPPVTTAPGEPARKNNPGQDYNCRCFAKPVVTFK